MSSQFQKVETQDYTSNKARVEEKYRKDNIAGLLNSLNRVIAKYCADVYGFDGCNRTADVKWNNDTYSLSLRLNSREEVRIIPEYKFQLYTREIGSENEEDIDAEWYDEQDK